MSELVGWLLAIAAGVAVLLWATRNLNGQTHCPNCGTDLDRYPHKPKCRYWRDDA